MNNSMRTIALARTCVRQFTQSAVRRSAPTEVTHSNFAKVKEIQKKFAIDDHKLVHVKGGFGDKALYMLTVALTVIGLGYSADTLVRLAIK